MRFTIFSHADHFCHKDTIYSYGPFVKEMNHWISRFDPVIIMAPTIKAVPRPIDLPYKHNNITLQTIPSLHFKKYPFKSFRNSLAVLWKCFEEMKSSDHIHIRCPGNIGLLAIMVSSLFPGKPKTVKYAGNWDPSAKQPISYRFQKWWLSNSILTQNTSVLVYGDWPNEGAHIQSFFTASFLENDKIGIVEKINPPFRFMFCGSLVQGKQPVRALEIIREIRSRGIDVVLDYYGDGPKKQKLLDSVESYKMDNIVAFHGNQSLEVLKSAYKRSDFVILPSKSEGWPKAIAEGMFFGCIPVATPVSCIPFMLDQGRRGILLEKLENRNVEKIIRLIQDPEGMKRMSEAARKWSQQYTLEKFDTALNNVLHGEKEPVEIK